MADLDVQMFLEVLVRMKKQRGWELRALHVLSSIPHKTAESL